MHAVAAIADHVVVLDGLQDRHFALEPPSPNRQVRWRQAFGPQNLDRDHLAIARLGPEDPPHAANAKLFDQPVFAERPAGLLGFRAGRPRGPVVRGHGRRDRAGAR